MSPLDEDPPITSASLRPMASSSQQSQSNYGDFPSFTALDADASEASSDAPSENQISPAQKPFSLRTSPMVITSEVGDERSERYRQRQPGSLKQLHPPNAPLTSEEYNAQLLSDPRMRQSSVVNPEFLQQYYRESRLHHLSTWKAELKAQLQAAAKEKSQSRVQRRKPVPGARRYILHVDFDSFFAAVSILKQPELKDKPVAVAHGSGSGSEIASCNYAARARGVKNGMWMKGALQACPELKVLPYDFPAYEEASRKFYSSVLGVDGIVQSVSIDEALIDVTNLCLEAGGTDGKGISEGSIYREQAKADEIAQGLRDSIKDKTGCAVSVGIGGNILLAKIALRKAKPAGQFQLKPEAVLDFIGNLAVQDLPGVGYSLTAKLEELSVKLVKDVRELSRERLISSLGPKTGMRIWEHARGIDRTEVGNEVVRKSVSAEVNWGIRFVNQDQADDFVRSLCEELSKRLIENLVKGKQLTLKVMRRSMDAPLEPVKHLGHGKCDVFNKSAALGVATNAADVLGKEAVSMLRSFNFSPGDLRGLGVQMTKLEALKAGYSTFADSSQQQLNFTKSPVRKKDSSPRGNTPRTPTRDLFRTAVNPPMSTSVRASFNGSASQFIMPTQADPKIISELPEDIRERLVAQAKPPQEQRPSSPTPLPRRAREVAAPVIPPQSQLDPEILAALPDDVRKEVLGYYTEPPVQEAPAPSLATAPNAVQSGRLGLKRPFSPPKKRRGRPPKSAKLSNPTLRQSSFGYTRPATTLPSVAPGAPQQQPPTEEQPEVSAEFLAALPEDIRQELLEEQQRNRVLQSSRPTSSTGSRPTSEPPAPSVAALPVVEKRLALSPRPKRPVFTSRQLSALSDLREAVGEWHSAFKLEGPYVEDVEVLCSYLHRVIVEEKDLDKAISVVSWLSWLVEDTEQQNHTITQIPKSGQGTVAWAEAIEIMHKKIQKALDMRGLPPADFG